HGVVAGATAVVESALAERVEASPLHHLLQIVRRAASRHVYALRARVQEAQDEVRITRQAHDRRDVERLRRAYAVHDLLVVHRLVLAVEGDEVESDGGTELDEIR